ncbi:hypothetical protein ACFFHM_20110 [Halalkalibacter kiskunsagensis]|uniref:YusW-like protein n=1 Tax=Halalkalibacter kiskunsagensis TaxID=1548599 RepID=A0ABV6KHB1_9BACI
MKKFGYMFIGAIFTLILSVGYMVFADTFNSSDAYLENEESFTTVSYESSEKLVMNEPEPEQVERVEETPFLVSTSNMSNESVHKEQQNNEVVTPEPVKETVEVESEPEKNGDFFQQMEKLEIEIEADKVKIEIKQERKKNRVKSEVEIEGENENIKLKNKKADEFLDKLFSSYEIHSAEDLQLLTKILLEDYNLDLNSAEIEIKVSQKNGKKYEYKHD